MLRKNLFLFVAGLFITLSFTTQAQASIALLFHQLHDPVMGNPKGNVTVVEFFDYQCGHCIAMMPMIEAIIKANPNVRVIFKDFPIRGPASEFAARAALAANMQGKYYHFSHALLTTNEPLSDETILKIAKSVGLNVATLKENMHSPRVNQQLKNNYLLAEEFNVTGTPAFFIGATHAKNSHDLNFVLGEMSQSELQSAINNAGKH